MKQFYKYIIVIIILTLPALVRSFFDIFEFSPDTSLNYTLFTSSAKFQELKIVRKNTSNKLIILEYTLIEHRIYPVYTTKYLDFSQEETEKKINITFSNPFWKENKRLFSVKISSANNRNRSEVYIQLLNDLLFIEFYNSSFHVYNENFIKINVPIKIENLSLTNEIRIYFITVPSNDENFESAKPFRDYWPPNGQISLSTNPQIEFQIFKNNLSPVNSKRMFRIYLLKIENCDKCVIGSLNSIKILITWYKPSFDDLLISNIKPENYVTVSNLSKSLCFSKRKNESSLLLISKLDALDENKVKFDLNETKYFLEEFQNEQCLDFVFDLKFNNYCFNLKFRLEIAIVLVRNLEIQAMENLMVFFSNSNCTRVKLDFNNIKINDRKTETIANNKSIQVQILDDSSKISIPILNFDQEIKLRIELDHFMEEYFDLETKSFNKTKKIESKSLISEFYLNAKNEIDFTIKKFKFSSLKLGIEVLETNFEIYSIDSSQKVSEFIFKIVNFNQSNCSYFSFDQNLTQFGTENNERTLQVAFLNSNLDICSENLNFELSKIDLNNQILNFIDPIYFNHILTKNSNFKIVNLSDSLKIVSDDTFLLRFLKTDSIKLVTDTYIILNANRNISNGLVDIQADFFDDINLYLNFTRTGLFGKVYPNFSLVLTHPLIEYKNKINASRDKIFSNQESKFTIGINLESFDPEEKFYGDLYLEGYSCYEEIPCQKPQKILLESTGVFGFITNYVETSSEIVEFGIERKFGSSTKANILYTLVSSESFTDLYFQNYDNLFSEFDFFEFISFGNLSINQVFTLYKKTFYLFLTNVESESGLAKISKNKNRLEISILPSPESELTKIVYFSKNYLKIPILIQKMYFNVPVNRLKNNSNTEIEVKVRSIGSNEFIPDYILIQNYESFADLAEPGVDYDPVDEILEFKKGDIMKSFILFVYPDFNYSSKVIFLYLFEPTNGAKLIEPNSKFSPYIKIELIDKITFGFSNFDNQTFNLINKRFIIEFYQSKILAYLVKYQIKLRIISLNGNIRNALNCEGLCEILFDCNTLETCYFTLDFISRESENMTLKINIVEINKITPSSLIISNSNESLYLDIYSTIKQQSYVFIEQSYILNINKRLQFKTFIEVKRKNNVKEELRVFYSTRETDEWNFSPNIKIYKSVPGLNFDLVNKSVTFGQYQTEARIEMLFKNSLEKKNYPIMFKLVLLKCEPECFIDIEFSFSNITIIDDNFQYWDFYHKKLSKNLDYKKMLTEISSLKYISGLQHDLLVKTLQNVTSENSNTLLKIYCHLLSVDDTLGKIEFLNLLENYLIENLESIVLGREYFRINCSQTNLNYNCLSSQKSLVTKYLGENYQVLNPDSSADKICFLEFDDTNFLGTNKNNLLLSKALVIKDSIENNELPIYLNLSLRKNVQTSKKCAIYDQNFNNWNFEYCTTLKYFDRIECKCSHRSIYGLASEPNNSYYGFNHTWIFICLSFVMFSCFLTLLTYKTCIKIPIFVSNILMHYVSSIFFTHLLYLITIAISSSIIGEEPYGDNRKCLVVSLFFHFFILSQFSCMFVVCSSIYSIIAKGVYKTSCFRLFARLRAWFLPLIIILVFYFITSLVYEFGYNYSAFYIYGDVFENKELCFIKSVWSFFASCIIPCTFMYLISVGFLVKVLRGDLDQNRGDIYSNRSNFEEILTLIGLNFLVFILNLIGALHIRNGNLWLFVLFCIFDFFLGFYILGFYVFKRHIYEFFRVKREEKLSPGQRKENKRRDLEVVTELGTEK